MKTFITTLLLLFPVLVFSQEKEPKLRQILVSKEKQSLLPIVAFTDYTSYVIISVLDPDSGYKSLKFEPAQSLVERGYGSYSDYVIRYKDGFLKYRVIENTENNKLNYKIIFDFVNGTNVTKREFAMISSLL